MIVLAPKLRVSEAELRLALMPMPLMRVRSAHSDGRAGHDKSPNTLPQQCGTRGLTPKLSRAAAGREACGKLYLPHGLRPDAVSA